MPRRATTPDEMKQNILREILQSLGVSEDDEYFSGGSTVTAEGLRAVRDEILRRQGTLRTIKNNLGELL